MEALSVDWGTDYPCAGYDRNSKNRVHEAVNEIGQLYVQSGSTVSFTYSVAFVDSPVQWANRMDHYKKLGKE